MAAAAPATVVPEAAASAAGTPSIGTPWIGLPWIGAPWIGAPWAEPAVADLAAAVAEDAANRSPKAGSGDVVGDAASMSGNGFTDCMRRSEEHTSELQSLMRISYAVFCLKKKKTQNNEDN